MIIRSNLHTHTVFSDGRNTAEEMVEAAIELGFKTLGISDHGFTPFDTSYCIQKENKAAYRDEIFRLKEKYADKITVLYGVEEDGGAIEFGDYDYVIGSMHYIASRGVYYPVDDGFEKINECRVKEFGGDGLKMVREYYRAFCGYLFARGVDIIGHFDLIRKHNQGERLFPYNEEYMRIATEALDAAMETGTIFEVNTGAMARHGASAPYPDTFLLKQLCEKGARVMLSSDCHRKTDTSAGFDAALDILREAGFKTVWQMDGEKLVETPI